MSNPAPNIPVNMFTLLKDFEAEVPPRVWQKLVNKLNAEYIANRDAAVAQERLALAEETQAMRARMADVHIEASKVAGKLMDERDAELDAKFREREKDLEAQYRMFDKRQKLGRAVEALAEAFGEAIAAQLPEQDSSDD